MVGVVITATDHANFQQQWEFALSNFGPDVLYAHGGIAMGGAVLSKATSIESPAELPQDHELVLVAPQNGANLKGVDDLALFNHPENVIYWFGSDSNHIALEVFEDRPPDHIVFIDTDTKDQMYSFASYLVVAWDRRMKEPR